jgi:hypothetical protein
VALAALIVAIIGAAAGVAALVRGELTRRSLQLATVVGDVAGVLQPFREQLEAMVATTPPTLPVFVSIFGQGMARLGELLPGVRDRPLRAHVTALLTCLDTLHATLPATVARGDGGAPNPNELQARQLAEARDVARNGATHAAEALRRITRLRERVR